MGAAEDFFGTSLNPSATAPKKEEGVVEGAVSKFKEFFGISPHQEEEPAREPIKLMPRHSVESMFPNLLMAETRNKHMTDGKLTTSPSGAEGVSQLMPLTAKKPGYGIKGVKDKSEAEYIRVGKEYLGAMLKKFEGDAPKALAAYNAGVGNVMKAVEKGGERWMDFLPRRKETLPYIDKILGTTYAEEKTSKEVGNLGKPNRKLDASRVEMEGLPSLTFEDLKKSGVLSYEGFVAYEKKKLAEHKASGNRADFQLTMEEAPDQTYNIARRLIGNPLTAKAIEFLSEHNPKISFSDKGVGQSEHGWVYSDKGDRVFLTHGMDSRTLSHETEHLLQQKDAHAAGMKKLPPHRANMLDTRTLVGIRKTPAKALFEYAKQRDDDMAIREVFKAGNSFEDYDEFYANLRSFTLQGLEDRNWSDTAFYKKLEKDVGEKDARTMMTDALLTLARKGDH